MWVKHAADLFCDLENKGHSQNEFAYPHCNVALFFTSDVDVGDPGGDFEDGLPHVPVAVAESYGLNKYQCYYLHFLLYIIYCSLTANSAMIPLCSIVR